MKINILLPFREKFDLNKASSVSITVKNNIHHSKYIPHIKIFGQSVDNPLFKENFQGIKYSFLSLKSKNSFIAEEMYKIILKSCHKKQLIEIHNRPYLAKQIFNKSKKFPITLFFHNDPKTMKGSKSVLEREKILLKCAGVFCVSEFIKKQFLDGIKNDFGKVHVLYNGVDRRLRKIPSKKKEVLFVGRLVYEKGAHIYTDVVSSVAKKFPEWTFGLIGSSILGNNNNKNFYARNIEEKFKNIGNQAKFYGFKNHEFVQNKMKDASIIIIPSLWEEPFGLVAAEAMSNGISIIASKVGGIPEIIGENGILIENVDSLKIEKSLRELLVDKKKRENLQRKSWTNFILSSKKSSKKLDCFRKIILEKYY